MSVLRTSFFFPSAFSWVSASPDCWSALQLCWLPLPPLQRGVSPGAAVPRGGGGHFLPLCVSLAISLAFLWGQPPDQVNQCHLKQHFRSQAGAGCRFWLASDVAQVKRDGIWHRDNADTSVCVTFSSWRACCLELLFKTIFKNTLQILGLLWKQSGIKVKQAGSTVRINSLTDIRLLVFIEYLLCRRWALV